MGLLDALLQLASLLGKVPTVKVSSLEPMFSSAPPAWLRALNKTSQPLVASIFIRNFGTKRVEQIVVKLGDVKADHPVEVEGLHEGSWSHALATNEIHINAIDPGDRAELTLHYETPPSTWKEPRVLADGRLIGWPSNLLGAIHELSGFPMLVMCILFAAMVFVVYTLVSQHSPELRMRDDIYDSYLRSQNMAKCGEALTLRAKDGEVNAATVSRHFSGIQGALIFNMSPSLDELLRRQTVFICTSVK